MVERHAQIARGIEQGAVKIEADDIETVGHAARPGGA
jgi:hypothetical protein